jgi:molecular chaperone GrpE
MAKGKDVMEEKIEEKKKIIDEQTTKDSKEQPILDEKDKKISELELQNVELIDLLQRKQAEFENYRKRIEKEQCEFAKHSSDRLICELLEVLDNFSLSIKHGIDEQGVKMIYEQFLSKLQKLGVFEYSMLGKKFDPNFCEVLCVQNSKDKEDGVVVEEIAKGYMAHDKVLRCAKVVINKKDDAEKKK